jgi:penicillin-binding protein 2
MITSSFMPEYKRQWIVDLKRKGLYKEPKPDSIKLKRIQDSLNLVKKAKEKLQKAQTVKPKKP